jgi:hypothetical protein
MYDEVVHEVHPASCLRETSFSYTKHISLLLSGRDGWNLEVCLMIAPQAPFCSGQPQQMDLQPRKDD